ncbi:MAG: DUF2868 domain-containing protein [Oligoflexus sp.]|nr:DUF2868 domain-containing protein [Oligoflexus sp.]
MGSDRFTMPDLLDYEAQIARDSLAEPGVLIARDRSLKNILVPGNKTKTLLAWTRHFQITDSNSAGATAKRSYDLLAFAAIVLGIISGSGLIQAMLHYDGTQPVNVIPLVAIYAVLQIVLLLNYIFKAFVYRLFKRIPGGALVYLLREAGSRWMQRRGASLAPNLPQKELIKAYTRRLSQLHRPLLQNHAWKIIQDFGIACHAASLLTFIALLFFNDYTFGWRTTLQLEPEWLHQITKTLALPFAWLGDFASPSLELIQKSQFSRFQKSFVEEGLDLGARVTAAWWPFLALIIAVYGLLPRLILWVILEVFIKSDLKNLNFHDFQSAALWARLSEEKAIWTNDGLEQARPPSDQQLYKHSLSETRNCVVLRWRDLPIGEALLNESLKLRFALNSLAFVNARGLATDADALIRILDKYPEAVLIVACDPWELPGEALDKIRLALRSRNKTKLMLFAPFEEHEGQALPAKALNKTAWQHAIQAFRDPYLGLLDAGESL